MKSIFKALSVSKYAEKSGLIGVNIGDYIQALASCQYYPHLDGFIDRDEELKEYSGPDCKVIMNGWYMHNPQNWPPSEKISPLFVAFHINNTVKDKLLSEESIKYLKKHEPIGCRDHSTCCMLRDKGVNAYFSGCMTLTLGKNYHSDKRSDNIYIVDPIMDIKITPKIVIKSILEIIKYPNDVFKLLTNKNLKLHNGRNILKKSIKTAIYHNEYAHFFGRDIIMNAEYISQDTNDYLDSFTTDEERLREAERLINLYSKAKFIITSRIHCALPCLGLNTPVIYISKTNDTDESSCRMSGLLELFNVVSINNGKLNSEFDTILPIGSNDYPQNKDSWESLSKELDYRCKNFVND